MNHPAVRKLLIWLVLACLLPGVIGATILLIYQYGEGRAQLEKNTLQTTRALVQAVDNHLLKVQAAAQALSTSNALATGDLALFHRQAREVAALAGLGTNVILRDETGRHILNTVVEFGEPFTNDRAPDQVRRVFATGKPAISDLFIGLLLKVPIMYVDVPIMRDGKVTHALSVGILPEHFSALLKAQNLPQGWVAAVFDSAGTIVGRTHASDQFVGHKAAANLLQSMMESYEGSINATTLEGTPVTSFYSRSSVTNWRVAIGIPRQNLEGALFRTLSVLAVGVAALFAIGLVLARLIGGRIAHSVNALTAPAIALGNGDSAPVPQVHIKEASEVALAIGRASDLLRERAAILQAREAELAEAHRLAKFGTWCWDLETGDVITSDSVSEIYGRELASFQDMRGMLLPVEVWDRLNRDPQQLMQTGKGYDLEVQRVGGSCDTIWVHSQSEFLQNENGEVVALRGTVQDITARKSAEDTPKRRPSAPTTPNRVFWPPPVTTCANRSRRSPCMSTRSKPRT